MIFVFCAVTIIIETAFLAAFGYRKRGELTVIVCANAVTNLLLNLLLMYILGGKNIGALIYPLETAVVASEILIYFACFGRSLRLALLTVAANCLSYGLGLLIF